MKKFKWTGNLPPPVRFNCRCVLIPPIESTEDKLKLLYGDKPSNTPIEWCTGPWSPKL